MAKHVRTEIIVNERFKIVHADALNWQVFEYREIKAAKDPTKRTRAGESDWITLPAFFSRPEYAIEHIAQKQFADGGEVYETLESAVKAIKMSNRKLVRDVAAALDSGN